MSTVEDKWRHYIEDQYKNFDSSANSIIGAAAAEYIRVFSAYETSKERIGLIAQRILQAQDHDPRSFVRAEPLFAKNGLKIYYQADRAEASIDAIVQDPQDVKQLELYRVNHIMVDRLFTESSSGGCSIQ